ncbi:MAG TPA: DipZ protein [Solirubrobacteraceae bacterium]|nr:DipZ protein [Solirubrobacteraceae bacterium]
MRAPVDHIAAPPWPPRLEWINGRPEGFPMLLEFWDVCRVQSLRTLPYMRAWHERYEGLTVVGIHAAGFPPSQDPDAVRGAVARLDVTYPVGVDTELQVWELYGNLGWPARYLFDQRGMLLHYHYGEGGYDETELAIQELLGIDEPLMTPIRPEESPDARLEPQTDDFEGPYSGPYTAGAVWAVLDGTGTVHANGRTINVDHPGAYELIAHDRSTAGELALEVGEGVACYAVCFTPGLAG